jgi:hypothetical protein
MTSRLSIPDHHDYAEQQAIFAEADWPSWRSRQCNAAAVERKMVNIYLQCLPKVDGFLSENRIWKRLNNRFAPHVVHPSDLWALAQLL